MMDKIFLIKRSRRKSYKY